MTTSLIIMAAFVVLLVMGTPAGIALGLPSAVYFMFFSRANVSIITYTLFDQLKSFTLVAVPMFVLMGSLITEFRLSDDIFMFLKKIMGNRRGYSAKANVWLSLIFAGMSGAAIADVGGLGQMEVQAMRQEGYSLEYAGALTAATSTIGPVFPPSIPMVLYAMLAETSSVQCLIGGVFPGILMAIMLLLMVRFLDRTHLPAEVPEEYRNMHRDADDMTLAQSFWRAFPALLSVPVVLLSMLFGIFNPSETGAVAVIYVLCVSFIKRTFSMAKLIKCLKETFYMCASVMIITAAGGLFSKVLSMERLPALLVTSIQGFSSSPAMVLILINIILLILGCFMSATPALVLAVPIAVPLTTALGFDPVHIGVMMVLNLMIGYITPPFGASLYAAAKVCNTSPEKLLKECMYLLAPLLIALTLVTFVPQISLWLPTMMFR
jgi:tripartite ATP-independent transporter DctM subunit